MAKDDDEQAKNGDAGKAVDPPKAARDASPKTAAKSDARPASDDEKDEDEGDSDEGEDSDEDEGEGDDSDEDKASDEEAKGEHGSKDDDDDEDEDEDESEEHDEPAEVAQKPAAASKAAAVREESPRRVKLATRPGHALARPVPIEAPPPPPPPVASMGKRVFVFAILLVGLSVGLYFLPNPEPVNGARFKVPSTNELTITVVPEDATALACGSKQEVAGRKCEYATKTEKNEGLDDMKMLKPYTAVDGVQFLAAGLWSQPVVEKSKLPESGTRFGLKCKYVVEGIVKAPLIRWNPAAAWGDKNPDWNAGYLKDCVVVPIEK